jgi:hypothetical protein
MKRNSTRVTEAGRNERRKIEDRKSKMENGKEHGKKRMAATHDYFGG